MKKSILTLAGLVALMNLSAQAPLGTWTSYLPYNNALSLAVTDDRVFCSTRGGMFYYSISDNSIDRFSKEDGLSDFEISDLGYSEESKTLIVAYTNANIDLIAGNRIYNIPDIKRKQILGDKKINDIHFTGNDAYLACGFGIVKLDLLRREIRETYLIGNQGMQVGINSVTNQSDNIYAATDLGLYSASLSGQNLIDFNNWHLITEIPLSGYRYTSLAATETRVYANLTSSKGDHDVVYVFDGISWKPFKDYGSSIVTRLSSSGKELIVCAGGSVQVLDETGNLLRKTDSGNPQSAVLSADNTLWIADRGKGLVRSRENESLFSIYPNGPLGLSVVDLEDVNGKLIAVAGGHSSSYNNLFHDAEIYSYRDHIWSNWSDHTFRDADAIAIDPDDTSHYYIATWGYGLLEFRDGTLIESYNENNSTLQTIIPNGNFIRIGSLAFDSDKNLWVPNSGVSSPLSVLKRNGEWKSFAIGAAMDAPNISKLIVTRDNTVWMVLPGGNGLFVYDYNGTIDNDDDDQFKKLSVVDVNNKLLTNDIQSIAEDRQGNIWLGTNQGVLVYYSPSRVFSPDLFYASQVIVPRSPGSQEGDLLLGAETVTAIKVDGANRKWLGTKSGGVFLVSEDGYKQIHSFNTENSPLLSNSITGIAIDDLTGEVFFGTFNGIISFMGDATGPGEAFNDVYVFPNPVRPGYQGEIVINGLIENTYIKITDLNGNLVHEAMSQGGRAVWDGRNLKGDRVSTGVYLIFCTNEDGTQTHVTKLMFIH